MKVRTNLDSKTTSQFPPPSMGGPRKSSYRGLSAVGVLDKPRVGRIRRSSVEESDAERMTVNVRFPRGVRDGMSKTSPQIQYLSEGTVRYCSHVA